MLIIIIIWMNGGKKPSNISWTLFQQQWIKTGPWNEFSLPGSRNHQRGRQLLKICLSLLKTWKHPWKYFVFAGGLSSLNHLPAKTRDIWHDAVKVFFTTNKHEEYEDIWLIKLKCVPQLAAPSGLLSCKAANLLCFFFLSPQSSE